MPIIEYVDTKMETSELLERLCPPVRNWFVDKFPDFTEPQKTAIPQILNGEHLLLCSPTGSGKTLTAFLSIIDDLVISGVDFFTINSMDLNNPFIIKAVSDSGPPLSP